MHTPILDRVIVFGKQQALFSKEARLLVAVSGGADSTALLSLLVRLRTQGFVKDLVCVHFNHQLRDQAIQDRIFVHNLATTWAVPFVSETQNTRAHAQTHHCSVETAGRQWRLERLISLAQAHACTAIATGHHGDDNAETLIHRLSRGTGFRGLCGIRPVRSHQGMRFISPLLVLTRQDILAYLADQQQHWCEDATNQDLIYTRNYIRHVLLPELSRQCPRLRKKLGNLSLRCHDLYTHRIETCASALLTSHVRFSPDSATATLSAIPHASDLVLVELMRQVLTGLGVPLRTVTRHHYQALIALIRQHTSHVNLPAKVCAVRDRGMIHFLRPSVAPKSHPDPVELVIPGATRFGDQCFVSRIIDVSQIDPGQHDNRHIEYLDLQKVTMPLQLRPQIPGDRFVPLGKTHSQKIGKFLSRAHIKGLDRHHAALLCDSEQRILWVCPVRMSELARVTEGTKEVIEVSLDPGA